MWWSTQIFQAMVCIPYAKICERNSASIDKTKHSAVYSMTRSQNLKNHLSNIFMNYEHGFTYFVDIYFMFWNN